MPAELRPLASVPPQAGMLQIGQHVVWWVVVPGSVLSGVLVVAVLAVARFLWHRGRVPSALSRRVWRRNYLAAVYALSRRPDIQKLDVLAPRLMPAKGNARITRLQASWEQINNRGKVRVLTLNSGPCLQAGAELLERGIEVRVVDRDLDSEDLTFHLFQTAAQAKAEAIINHHDSGADKPAHLKGAKATRPHRNDFEAEWAEARPLESVVAEMSLPPDPYGPGQDAVLCSFQQASARLHLHDRGVGEIRPHLAFRASSRVVFIVGQPGSGKSYIRGRLAERLRSMRIQCHWLTDYPYAYIDLVRTALQIYPPSRNGYKAHPGGAFIAHDEATLRPALRALERDVQQAMQKYEVTLVEFARSDLVAAFREFEAVSYCAQVIHVSAPAELRLARIDRRARPPGIRVSGEEIVLTLSDDHLLPSRAARTLYAWDGIGALKESRLWQDRIFEIDNRVDGESHVDKELNRFLDQVIAPYRQATPPSRGITLTASV
jgi:dephospho-CoA kinase